MAGLISLDLDVSRSSRFPTPVDAMLMLPAAQHVNMMQVNARNFKWDDAKPQESCTPLRGQPGSLEILHTDLYQIARVGYYYMYWEK